MSFNVTDVVPSVTVVTLGVVVIAGLAGLTVTCSVGGVVLAGRVVVGVAAVAGVPLVGARHRARRRQRVARRRRVRAVAVDRTVSVSTSRAAQVQRERDRAGLVIAAGQRPPCRSTSPTSCPA